MSRIGNKPVEVSKGVEVKIDGPTISVKGSKGELTLKLEPNLSVELKDGHLVVSRSSEEKYTRSMHGTTRSLLSNMIEGVDKGYSKNLDIQGVGYRAQLQGQKLVLNLGFSHPIEFIAPDGIQIVVKDNTSVEISGIDKQMVGQVSAQIRSYSPAEPYKGKGVRYKDEQVRRKAGKTVA